MDKSVIKRRKRLAQIQLVLVIFIADVDLKWLFREIDMNTKMDWRTFIFD